MTSLAIKAFKMMNQGHVWVYRKSGGRLANMKDTVGILTTTGRKSGQPHSVPLNVLVDGDRFLVAASAGGDRRAPALYHNLKDNPEVRFQKGAHEVTMQARVATPEERPELWARFVEANARFGTYEAKAGREIPVVIIEPR